ncbi:hypothetical protein H2248_002007 [Termitomyces sp. 'cryptogamus']|nr:hypothetical protein H2248_002007 [Termitomyces sp. 'cryptogamus']
MENTTEENYRSHPAYSINSHGRKRQVCPRGQGMLHTSPPGCRSHLEHSRPAWRLSQSSGESNNTQSEFDWSRLQIARAILDGFSAITASYLARARGSNGPELPLVRVKDLSQFIHQSEAFQMDFGLILDDKYDKELQDLRDRFEGLLGNSDG